MPLIIFDISTSNYKANFELIIKFTVNEPSDRMYLYNVIVAILTAQDSYIKQAYLEKWNDPIMNASLNTILLFEFRFNAIKQEITGKLEKLAKPYSFDVFARARRMKNETQTTLAKKLSIGVSTIANLEKDYRYADKMRKFSYEKILRYLDTELRILKFIV